MLLSGFKITEVVSGGSRGVDYSGELWAIENDLPIKKFEADWHNFGKAAGPKRNREMAQYADCLIAVWDGRSPGTRNMISAMQFLEKSVYVHRVGLAVVPPIGIIT